jgi:hypothetical protein
MNAEAKALLDRLLRMRPKPSEAAVKELMMAIKATPIDELMKLIRGVAAGPTASGSPLEASLKKRLRKVGGKAVDFVPYLVDEVGKSLVGSGKLDLPKKPSLGAAVAAAEQLLGAKAAAVATKAFEKYVEENDISYRLKSA